MPIIKSDSFSGGSSGSSSSGGYRHKSPFLALILSFFIPGLGQVYNGQILKGIGYFILTVILAFLSVITLGLLFIVYFIWWIWNIYDAYHTAVKINGGY
ncbi:DUF5683 domain-containing protein [Methanorbis rubei]|uniref:DUF5683 domain-containing protein n=1 Tax=Methanorbis rubei TaxID=3028300 RepID=A0AAE4SB70_9EURY|nr:hypothetical protein [Methanocorpusculaceae archaeon Cs1]